MNNALLDAVKERLELGHSKEDIRQELYSAGYDDQVIEEVFAATKASAVSKIPQPIEGAVAGGSHSYSTTLPGVGVLFENGWRYMLSRLDLVALVAVPWIVFEIVNFFLSQAPGWVGGGVVALVGVAVMVLYFIALATILHAIVESNSRRVALSEALAWGRKHVFSLFWVYLLTSLIIFGGYMLFVIPGIVLSVVLYFSQYALAKEGVKGMTALLRSRDVIRGNGWAVAGRLLALLLIFIVAMVVVGLVVGLALGFSTFEAGGVAYALPMLITNVLMQILSAVVLVIATHYGMSMYERLAAARPIATTPVIQTGKWKYVVLACLGLLFPIVLVVVIGFSIMMSGYGTDFPLMLDESYNYDEMDSGVWELPYMMSNVQLQAQRYYAEQGFLYSGVCSEIEPAVAEVAQYSDCIETEDDWALSVTVESGEQWCVDSESEPVRGPVSLATGLCENSSLNDGSSAKERANELRDQSGDVFETPTYTDIQEW